MSSILGMRSILGVSWCFAFVSPTLGANTVQFPDGFFFGAATAAYQVRATFRLFLNLHS